MADNPESQNPSSRKKRVTHNRQKRQHAIQEIILLEGITEINQITEKLKIRGFRAERHGVSEDMQYMMYDGEYWHSLDKVKKRDIIVTERLEKTGYKIIRFSDQEIINNIRNVIHSIIDEIIP